MIHILNGDSVRMSLEQSALPGELVVWGDTLYVGPVPRTEAAATVRDVPVGEQLCQQHCPVAHVAHEFPQLCEAETEAISLVLGRHVQRLATIAHGDGVCTTCIPSTQMSGTPTTPKERVS